MNRTDIAYLSATELSRLIRSKEISPVELTELYLDRIDNLDFQYNSYLTVTHEEALLAAQRAEQEIARGKYKGPMHGLPVAVKDQFWTKGVRTTGASRILMDFIPDEDANVIANLKKSGAVILGKTNMTEFAITGFSHRFSTPRNPWNINMYAGGSSSGSAAATAGYLCSTSLGEDTGGSIRFPASWCGLVGHRPTWGLVSRHGVMPGVWSMDTVGPISRTVEDAALTLGAISGYDVRDRFSFDRPVPNFQADLTGDIKGIKVGVVKEQLFNELVEPEVRSVVSTAIDKLTNLGASVEEVSIPLSNDAAVISGVLLGVEPAINQKQWVRDHIKEYGHDNRIGLLTGSIVPAQAYYKAQQLRNVLRNQVLETLETYDVLVLPTSGKTAQPVVEDPPITGKDTVGRLQFLLTRLFNLSNAPAVTVPCGFDATGLPIGLQIGGCPGGDSLVLRVAHAYEQNTQWHKMKPQSA
ncbi:amidase [SAR202 cluster bacterium AD-804-J14_MRT_500m]|nr:amidase [SAR202 cluster bacterium AD-804-J14_MRT_500m]